MSTEGGKSASNPSTPLAPSTPTLAATPAVAAAPTSPAVAPRSFFDRYKTFLIAGLLIVTAIAAGFWLGRIGRNSDKNQNRLVLYGNVDLRQVDLAFNDSERLKPLDAGARIRLVTAMAEIRSLLDRETAPLLVNLRGLQPGDLGWITHRQAVIYHEEYGWDRRYEGLVSGILGKFVTNFDSARDDAWVADQGGNVIGSIFLMHGDEPGTGKLRLLYVEPGARGPGVGRKLVETCVA